jgi:GH15 family glucan-1,4-alpha-glucosidase
MPRDLPLGNGRLLVAFDREYTLWDLYWPHVGHESHVRGARCRFGVWAQERTDAGGRLSWLHEAEWSRVLEYEPETLITRVTARHAGLELICSDVVDLDRDLLLWVADRAFPSGVLAEQVHPRTGAPLSVSPLTWSHAGFVGTVHRFLDCLKRMQVGKPGTTAGQASGVRRQALGGSEEEPVTSPPPANGNGHADPIPVRQAVAREAVRSAAVEPRRPASVEAETADPIDL